LTALLSKAFYSRFLKGAGLGLALFLPEASLCDLLGADFLSLIMMEMILFNSNQKRIKWVSD